MIQETKQLINPSLHTLFKAELKTPQKQKNLGQNFDQTTKEKSNSFISKKFHKSVWTKEEDELLKAKVIEMGPTQWAEIALYLKNRSGKQCRQRWHNHLREGVTKGAWDSRQYWMLALCVKAFGRRWSAISQFIPGRSDNTIKNQWNCKMKPFKQQFNLSIEKLLAHSECWQSLTVQEQTLLKIIKKNKNDEISPQNKFMLSLLEKYSSLIETGMSQYAQTKRLILSLTTDSHHHLYEEAPGQLSAAISAGQGIFCESEEENPIMPLSHSYTH